MAWPAVRTKRPLGTRRSALGGHDAAPGELGPQMGEQVVAGREAAAGVVGEGLFEGAHRVGQGRVTRGRDRRRRGGARASPETCQSAERRVGRAGVDAAERARARPGIASSARLGATRAEKSARLAKGRSPRAALQRARPVSSLQARHAAQSEPRRGRSGRPGDPGARVAQPVGVGDVESASTVDAVALGVLHQGGRRCRSPWAGRSADPARKAAGWWHFR